MKTHTILQSASRLSQLVAMGAGVWLGYRFGVEIQGAPLGVLLAVNGALFGAMLVPVR